MSEKEVFNPNVNLQSLGQSSVYRPKTINELNIKIAKLEQRNDLLVASNNYLSSRLTEMDVNRDSDEMLSLVMKKYNLLKTLSGLFIVWIAIIIYLLSEFGGYQ